MCCQSVTTAKANLWTRFFTITAAPRCRRPRLPATHAPAARPEVMVATSNRPPGDLYEGGLNRTHFLPFIPLLEHHCAVVPISSDEDYRARTAPVAGRFITADSTAPAAAPSAAAQLEQQYLASTGGHRGSPLTLEISATRRIEVPRAYADVAFFRFEELCGAPVGSKTFAALCRRFRVIAVADIPQ